VFIGGQLALISQPPLVAALAKNLISSICLVIILCYVALRRDVALPNRDTYVPLFIMGLFGVFLYTMFVYVGLSKTTAVSASLLIPTIQPTVTVLLANFVAKERITGYQICGLTFGVLGAIIILTGNWELRTSGVDLIGDILIVIAAVCFSVYSVFGKKALKYHSPLEATTYSTIIGTILLMVLAAFTTGATTFWTASYNFWMIMIYLVVFAGVIPLIWWYNGVKKIGASKTGVLTLLMPPISLLLAIPILHQKPSLFQLCGGGIGLLGVAFASGLIKMPTRTHQKNN